MKHIFKKNQIIVTALALMIAAAGYFNYNRFTDEKELATQSEVKPKDSYRTADVTLDESEILTDTEEDTGDESAGETVLTSSAKTDDNKAANLKLAREQTRAANKAGLNEVINNTSLTEKERTAAVEELAKIADVSEREAACEMMLEAKGFEDIIVSISGVSADVVVNDKEIKDEKRAQIEDIVCRKGNISPENIVISTITKEEKKK